MKILIVTHYNFAGESSGASNRVLELAKALSNYASIKILHRGHDMVLDNLEFMDYKPIFSFNVSNRISDSMSPYVSPIFPDFYRVAKRLVANADVIVTVSEASRNDILSVRKNAPIVVIPNGLATYSYMRNSSVTYNDKVVFIGRAIYYKNLEVVLNALKFVVQRKPEAELIVIGTGPMRSLWEKLVTKYGICSNVTFKGHVSEEEKVKILSEATCLVLPSLWEGFGVVVLEAWALKKPVIVAKVKPLSDIVTHEKDGFHLDPFNPLEWAKHLQMLLQDKNLARRMGEAGYDKLVKNFTIQNSVDKLENLYIKLDNLQKSFSIPSAGKDTD